MKCYFFFMEDPVNPFLVREGQICSTKPKTLKFGGKYTNLSKRLCDKS